MNRIQGYFTKQIFLPRQRFSHQQESWCCSSTSGLNISETFSRYQSDAEIQDKKTILYFPCTLQPKCQEIHHIQRRLIPCEFGIFFYSESNPLISMQFLPFSILESTKKGRRIKKVSQDTSLYISKKSYGVDLFISFTNFLGIVLTKGSYFCNVT